MADLRYEDLLPVGADETRYRMLSRFRTPGRMTSAR